MSTRKLPFHAAFTKLNLVIQIFHRYSLLFFTVFVALLYGFVLFRASSLAHTEPSQTDVTSRVQAAQVPHINESVVRQLKSLQDNSVNVQALFEEARSNPFQQ